LLLGLKQFRRLAAESLSRDEAGLFRAIDLGVSIPAQEAARNLLMAKLEEHSAAGQSVFPQRDAERDSMDLFKPVVSTPSFHSNYRILVEELHHPSANEMLGELARGFVDVDGNFLEFGNSICTPSSTSSTLALRRVRPRAFRLGIDFEVLDFTVDLRHALINKDLRRGIKTS
jgi:hypothetical protein